MNSIHTSEIKPAVAAIIFNKDGDVLLQKRRDNNKWCIISGHVEFGETVTEAVLREIYEETNVNAVIRRFIGIYSSPVSQTYYYPHKKIQYITHYFEASLLNDIPPSFSNIETKELRYFKLSNLPVDLAQMHPSWLDDALNNNTQCFIR